jgi:hypothetical protein
LLPRQKLKPTKLGVEFWSRRGIAVGKIKTSDDDPANRRFDVATMRIVGVTGQAATGLDGLRATREDRHAIPALLPMPDCAVTGGADSVDREFLIGRLQLLEAGDVRLGLPEPIQEDWQTCVDAVDIEGCDFHWDA